MFFLLRGGLESPCSLRARFVAFIIKWEKMDSCLHSKIQQKIEWFTVDEAPAIRALLQLIETRRAGIQRAGRLPP